MNRAWHTITAAVWSALDLSLTVAARAGAAISSIQRPPAPAGATNTILQGVSCTSADACISVGSRRAVGDHARGAMGRAALDDPANHPTGWVDPELSRRSLLRLGVELRGSRLRRQPNRRRRRADDEVDSLVEQMRGIRWTLERAPDPEQINLFGVSCAGSVCVAVGAWIDRSGSEAPLAESILAPR